MYLCACALAVLVTATSQSFYFSKSTDVFRRAENCQMCYHEQCFILESARCEYYLLADEILQGNENLGTPGIRMKADDEDESLKINTEVNEALFDLVERASEAVDKDCIPYISQYTDCTKENICLGCTSCVCSADGKWNCSEVQTCRAEKTTTIDHRMLAMVIDNLMNTDDGSEDKTTKTKRSVTEEPLNSSTNKITFEELSEWWYGVKPLEHDHINQQRLTTAKIDVTTTTVASTKIENGTSTTITTTSGSQTTESTTETLIIPDPDNLAFDEVLSNIGIDTKKYVRRKLPMDLVQNDTIYDVDYMFLNEMKPMHNHNITDVIPNMLGIFEGVDDGIEGTKGEASKVVIDLLESAKKNNRDIKNVTDYMEIYKSTFGFIPPFEHTNDIIEYDAVNIMKREVSHAANITDTANFTSSANVGNATAHNVSKHKCHNMNDTILTSLSDLISDMHKELRELQSVKEHLINFVKSYTSNVTNQHNTTAGDVNGKRVSGNTSKFEKDLRRSDRNMQERYMKKLKHDIYEVLRDIVGIQKYKSAAEYRDDLKDLIRAMKRYVSNSGLQGMRLNQIKLNRFRDLRRYWSIYRHSTSPKDNIIRILNIIDKEMPKPVAVDALSVTARKIVNRVIKQYYIDDFSAVGLRAHDSTYNLTNDLQSVGTKWQQFGSDTENSSPFEKPYSMKLLHFVLVQDMYKIKDALALVDFAHSRRVIPIFRHMEQNIIEKISTSLTSICDKMTRLLQIHNRLTKKPVLRAINKNIPPSNVIIKEDAVDRGEKQKKSFLKQLRNLLRGSKKDIVELLNKRVPKAEIVKKIAKKKMSELAQKRYDEYEATMKRWQKNLNVQPRRKRSMLDTNGFRARMKNIIPKYLRGKVTGKIDAKKKKNVIPVKANKTTKPKGNTKTRSGKGNRTTQKPSTATPKMTTPLRLGDY